MLAQPRRLALLAYLAVTSPSGPQRRDRLLALFWRDYDQERARAALNRAIYFLRRALGDGVLQSHREEISLDRTQFSCDAADFDQAVDAKRYREALDLYRGDLLPGFFVSHAPGFEEWLETERTRLRDRAVVAAWALTDCEEEAGRLAAAAQFARRGVELAPFREVGLRRLLLLLERAGDRGAAAQAYDRFVHDMAVELDVAPSPETQALIDAIRSGTRPPAPIPALVPDDPPAASAGPAGNGDRADGGATNSRPTLAGSRRRTRIGTMTALSLGALLAIALIASGPEPTLDPARIDVEPFANRTGDPAHDALARGATEQVISGLRQTGLFPAVVPVPRPGSRGWRPAWARLLGRGPRSAGERGAVTVAGALSGTRGALLLDAWLTDARRDRPVWALPAIPVSLNATERATRNLLQRVIGGAAALQNPYTARFLPDATPPPLFEAYQEFVDGVSQSSRGQVAEAQRLFRLAVAHDSSFTWPMVEAALIGLHWAAPSPVESVDSILDALARIRSRVPPLQRHLLDYLQALRVEDWRTSHRAICEAAALAPLRFAYRCAIAASHVNRPRATIEALSESPGVDSLHRRNTQNYWLVLTLAYHQLGEHRNELAAARRARESRPESPSALAQEIRALAALGRVAAVRARLDTLVALGREGWFTPAVAMLQAAEELRAHGYPEAAVDITARAIAWHRARPAEEQATEARRYQLGWTLYFHQDWAAADSVFRVLADEFPDNEDYLGFLGVIAARQGDREAARMVAARLATLEHWIPVPGQTSIYWRAKIEALLGERETALNLLRDAFGPDGTMQLHSDIDVESLQTYPPFRDFIRPKG